MSTNLAGFMVQQEREAAARLEFMRVVDIAVEENGGSPKLRAFLTRRIEATMEHLAPISVAVSVPHPDAWPALKEASAFYSRLMYGWAMCAVVAWTELWKANGEMESDE
jgi:hypothetical protein